MPADVDAPRVGHREHAFELGDDDGEVPVVAEGSGDLGDEDALPEIRALEARQRVFPARRLGEREIVHSFKSPVRCGAPM